MEVEEEVNVDKNGYIVSKSSTLKNKNKKFKPY